MIIDFHTHLFPEAIAERVLKTLSDNLFRFTGEIHTPCTDGTVNGLRDSMRKNKVDISVVLPIATKPSQTTSINAFAENIMSKDIISFGSLHPMQEDWERVLESLAEKGFKGIKLHPQYQQVRVDAPEFVRVLKKAEELQLYTVLHAGEEFGMEPPSKCTPQMRRNILNDISGEYIIAAHLGGLGVWDEVEKLLVGTPYIFDTGAISNLINKDQYKRIIKNHGSKKIVFATDSPWENVADTLSAIDSLDLTDEDLEFIMYKNALRILNI